MKLLIRGESVYDGTGAAPFPCDILVEDGVIAEMGPRSGTEPGFGSGPSGSGLTVISGKTVCPGFIDIHRHCDSAVFDLTQFGKTELLQGITTVVCGNCGMSPVPLNSIHRNEYYQYIEPVTGPITGSVTEPETPDLPGNDIHNFVPVNSRFENYGAYRQALENFPLPLNFGFLAGAGAIKTAVKGFSKLPFTAGEMSAAKRLIHEAFDTGVLGLSFGLMYQPECYSGFDELTEFAKTAKAAAGTSGTILCFHIRGEGGSLVESVDEVIRIAGAADLRANISHFKATGINNWRSLIYRAIEKIEDARYLGLDITADFYPYNGGSTTILSLIPPAFMEDGVDALSKNLANKYYRDSFRAAIKAPCSGWDNMVTSIGWDRIILSSVYLDRHQSWCGRSMEDIARGENYEDPTELLAELVRSEQGRTGIITFSMDQTDIDTIAALPWTCLISDSLYNSAGSPHPRLNGAFPKFLREYVRERKILSMEQAIYKMTGMPAARLNLKNRGILKKGCAADILIFDPIKFRDRADYSNPSAMAEGLDAVILNGKIVYNKNVFDKPNGKVIAVKQK
ncbi:MAG: amidohydrolase family protein [Treponema sp.]|nr:amidohydrolase family protein [Treponema sp.]